MNTPTKLTPTQTAILQAATDLPDGRVVLPCCGSSGTRCRLTGGRSQY